MKKHKAARYNRVGVFDVVLYIVMILFMACIILPFVHIIAVSLSPRGPVSRGEVGLWPVQPSLNNYIEMLSDGAFLRAYGVTIFVTVVGTCLSLMCTAAAAYALSRRKIVGHNLFSVMIMITMFFGGGLVPVYMTVSNYGLIDSVFAMILPGMISTWNLIIMRSFFVAYPKEIIESGMIDGLRDSGVFFRLVLPTSKAALATIGLYYAVAYWNSYMPAELYIRNVHLWPAQKLLQDMMENAADRMITMRDEDTELVAASLRNCAIMIVITPIMCVYPFIQKYFVKGVMVGSIKG